MGYSDPDTDHDLEAAPEAGHWLFSQDENRRHAALTLALNHIDIEMDDRSAQDIADLIVKAAKVFEAYLKGEAQS